MPRTIIQRVSMSPLLPPPPPPPPRPLPPPPPFAPRSPSSPLLLLSLDTTSKLSPAAAADAASVPLLVSPTKALWSVGHEKTEHARNLNTYTPCGYRSARYPTKNDGSEQKFAVGEESREPTKHAGGVLTRQALTKQNCSSIILGLFTSRDPARGSDHEVF